MKKLPQKLEINGESYLVISHFDLHRKVGTIYLKNPTFPREDIYCEGGFEVKCGQGKTWFIYQLFYQGEGGHQLSLPCPFDLRKVEKRPKNIPNNLQTSFF